VKAGHGCLAAPPTTSGIPVLRSTSGCRTVPGFGVDVTAGEIGLGLTGVVAGATVVHGIASAVRDRMRNAPAVPPPANNKPPSRIGGAYGTHRD
jgi:Ni,Fe-hydrogenase I small subunit